VVALAGLGLAASLSWLHLQIEASGDAHTSFCNVNETINCDRVLTSSFAKLLGVPVANLALLAYGALALAMFGAARSSGDSRERLLRLTAFGAIGAVIYSAYMALVSFFVLETICLMCSGLYVVALSLLGITAAAAARLSAVSGRPPITAAAVATVTAVSALAVGGVAVLSWPVTADRDLSAEEIRTHHPEFYQWFTDLPVQRMPASGERGNIVGSADAPVTIVEFFDFECGHCNHSYQRLQDLLQRRPAEVRVVYRHFPLDPSCNEAVPQPIHTRACRAAEAAECAGRQGRFSDMADAMFKRQGQLFESNLPSIAEKVGLDMDDFRRCMAKSETLDDVIDDCRAGQTLEITSTPTMFFNGRRIKGSIDEETGYDFAVTIEAALQGHDLADGG
jgi:protein-disulfide isomerase